MLQIAQDSKVLISLIIRNMYNIIDELTGLLLFAKNDNEVLKGQIAISQMCNLENPEQKPIYWDFENELFYIKP